mgnify:CR=1 FL=1
MSDDSGVSTGTDSPYLNLLRERVVVFDGAAGTYLQQVGLTADDFGSEALEGCTDLLSVTRPDVIAQMHADYFEAGADVVETNSFGAFGIPLGEYDIVFVYDAPDDAISSRFLLLLGASGFIRTKTMKAFPESAYREIIASLG